MRPGAGHSEKGSYIKMIAQNTEKVNKIIEGIGFGEYRLYYLGEYLATSYAPTELLALKERAEIIAELPQPMTYQQTINAQRAFDASCPDYWNGV